MYVLQKYKGHCDDIYKMVHFDGYLYSVGDDGIMIKWNIKNKTSGLIDKILILDSEPIYITAGKFNNEIDNNLYSANIDSNIIKWKNNKEQVFIRSEKVISYISFIKGYLYSGDSHGIITKWNSKGENISIFVNLSDNINRFLRIAKIKRITQ